MSGRKGSPMIGRVVSMPSHRSAVLILSPSLGVLRTVQSWLPGIVFPARRIVDAFTSKDMRWLAMTKSQDFACDFSRRIPNTIDARSRNLYGLVLTTFATALNRPPVLRDKILKALKSATGSFFESPNDVAGCHSSNAKYSNASKRP